MKEFLTDDLEDDVRLARTFGVELEDYRMACWHETRSVPLDVQILRIDDVAFKWRS